MGAMRFLLGMVLMVSAADVDALTMRAPLQVISVLHAPLAVEVPFELAPGEVLPEVGAFMAVHSNYVGGHANERALTARLEIDGRLFGDAGKGQSGRILIAGSQPVDAPFVSLLLRVSQEKRVFMRNFSLVFGAVPSRGIVPIFPVDTTLLPISGASGGAIIAPVLNPQGWLSRFGQQGLVWIAVLGLLLLIVVGGLVIRWRRRPLLPHLNAWQLAEDAREKLVVSGMLDAFVEPSATPSMAANTEKPTQAEPTVYDFPKLQMDLFLPNLMGEMPAKAPQPEAPVEGLPLEADSHEQVLSEARIFARDALLQEMDLNDLADEAGLSHYFSSDQQATGPTSDPQDQLVDGLEEELADFGGYLATRSGLDDQPPPLISLVKQAENTFIPKKTTTADDIEMLSFDFNDLNEEKASKSTSIHSSSASRSEGITEEERILSLEFEPYDSDDSADQSKK